MLRRRATCVRNTTVSVGFLVRRRGASCRHYLRSRGSPASGERLKRRARATTDAAGPQVRRSAGGSMGQRQGCHRTRSAPVSGSPGLLLNAQCSRPRRMRLRTRGRPWREPRALPTGRVRCEPARRPLITPIRGLSSAGSSRSIDTLFHTRQRTHVGSPPKCARARQESTGCLASRCRRVEKTYRAAPSFHFPARSHGLRIHMCT